MDEYVVIPRNIRVREVVAYGLNSKQMIYLVLGVGGSIALWSMGIPLDLKMAGSVLAISGSLLLTLAKAHGQDLDKYIVNSIAYPFRQKTFGGDTNVQKAPLVRIRYVLQ